MKEIIKTWVLLDISKSLVKVTNPQKSKSCFGKQNRRHSFYLETVVNDVIIESEYVKPENVVSIIKRGVSI